MKHRCEWCGTDPLYIAYHDDEWGVPVHDDRRLFEFLILEGAQSRVSISSAARSSMRTCRRSGWSTTIFAPASGISTE